MVEQTDLNRFLRAKQYFLANEDKVFERLATAVCNVFGGIVGELPQTSEDDTEPAFAVPLINAAQGSQWNSR